MIKRPLWELSKSSLSEAQNRQEFNDFLRKNQRQTDNKYINPQLLYRRLTVLLTLKQLSLVSQSYWILIYLIVKMAYLFKFRFDKIQILDIVVLLGGFFILSNLATFLPYSIIYWLVNLRYFLFGIEEKYLSLSLMMNGLGFMTNSWVLIIFSLCKIKQHTILIEFLLIIDFCLMLMHKYYYQSMAIAITFIIIQIVCEMDRNLIKTKKKYSHLFSVPKIQEYY